VRTLSDHLEHVPAGEGLSILFGAIAEAGKQISSEIVRAGLSGDLGSAGRINVQGEEVQKLDETAQEIFATALASCGQVAIFASEEKKEASVPPAGRRGRFAVSFDPLDGSSNIDTNVSIGTIFSVHRRRAPEPATEDLLQPGRHQVAAGYLVYGPRTTFTYTAGRGTHTFTLEPESGEFVLLREHVQIPPKGTIYSTNEGNSPWWHPGTRRFVEWVKSPDPASGRPYSTRYVGSLVADFHRTLLHGGIFLYPEDTKDPKKPSGKLRLLYECAPIAFVAEQAGGAASTGKARVLDLEPRSLHERCPFVVGSREDVARYDEFRRTEPEQGVRNSSGSK
jgi:fructose-1,6-bisphosphatase I